MARPRGRGTARLVLSHFSRRYDDVTAFCREAREEFADVVIATDFDRIPIPSPG